MKVPRTVSLGTALGVGVVFIGAAAAFAWFFLRGKVAVSHTVKIDDDEGITMHQGGTSYTSVPP